MRLFIVEDGKWNEVTESFEDAVVCQFCLQNDYGITEGRGYNDAAVESELNGMDRAPAGSVCWLCNEEDPA